MVLRSWSAVETFALAGLLVAIGAFVGCGLTTGCPPGLFRGQGPADAASRPSEQDVAPGASGQGFHDDNNLSGGDTMSTIHSAAGSIEHASEADFQVKVLDADVPVLVDFYADWCGPCRLMAPVLEEFARENPGAKVVKVNVDQSPGLAMQYEVSAIPTLAAFKVGQVIADHVGMASKQQLKRMLGL